MDSNPLVRIFVHRDDDTRCIFVEEDMQLVDGLGFVDFLFYIHILGVHVFSSSKKAHFLAFF